jgi:hypothetical protein
VLIKVRRNHLTTTWHLGCPYPINRHRSLRAQLRYIFMRLEGAAKTNVTTFYKMQLRQESPDPCRLLKRLDILYRERNRKQKAI